MKIKETEFGQIANLVAFFSVLTAIVVLARFGDGKGTDLSIMTGLIGVLGSFRPWVQEQLSHVKAKIEQPKNEPVPVIEAPTDTTGELPPEQKL